MGDLLTASLGRTILFTDLVGSLQGKRLMGETRWSRLLAEHNACFREQLNRYGGVEHDNAGDGFFASFDDPAEAVRCALGFQRRLAAQGGSDALATRIGIHHGQVLAASDPQDGGKPLGIAVDVTSRLTHLARGRQILMTTDVFDSARTSVGPGGEDASLHWLAHGPYLFRGLDEPIEVFEVGVPELSPLLAPESADSSRALAPGEEEILGWRPSAGGTIPERPGWLLEAKLGMGGTGEVWLARDAEGARRVFKFCFQIDRLRTLKREATFLRLLKASLGERHDIIQILDWHYERPPFFLECEYCSGRDLGSWAAANGGIEKIPMAQRIELAAQTADALAAAHSCGILHKDVKPSNILIETEPDGDAGPRARLADFGIGQLFDREASMKGILTLTGLTQMTQHSSSGSGTPIYLAPELHEGRPPTVQSDLYALGVVLYQLAVGALGRPLGLGWEREIDDPLLAEDIRLCVDGDPARRLAAARELAERLRNLEQRRIERRAEQEQIAAATRAKRRRRALSTALVAISLLACALTIGFYREAGLRKIAEEARVRVENTNRQLTWENYVVSLSAIQRMLEAADYEPAGAMLEKLPVEMRDWEWGYLNRFAHLPWVQYRPSEMPAPSPVRGRLLDVKFSPNNRYLLEVRQDAGSYAVFEIDARKYVYVGNGRIAGDRRNASFASDNRTFYAATDDTHVERIDFFTGKTTVVFDSGTGALRSFRATGGDKGGAGIAVDAKSDAQLLLWGAGGGLPARRIDLGTIENDTYRRMAPSDHEWRDQLAAKGAFLGLSTDGKAAYCSTNKVLRVDLESGAVEPIDDCHSLAYYDAGTDRLVFWRPNGYLVVCEATTGKQLARLEITTLNPNEFGLAGAFSGARFAYSWNRPPGQIKVYNTDTGNLANTIGRKVSSLDYGNKYAMLAGQNGRDVMVMPHRNNIYMDRSYYKDGEGVSIEQVLKKDLTGWSFSLSPDRKQFVAGTGNGLLSIFDTDSLALHRIWKAHQSPVRTVAWSPDGRFVASTGADRRARVFEAKTGEPRHSLEVLKSQEFGATAFAPDGATWAVAVNVAGALQDSSEGRIGLMDLKTSATRWLEPRFPGGISLVQYTPDGHGLIIGRERSTGGDEPVLSIVDAATGLNRAGAVFGEGRALRLAWSPDRKRFLIQTTNAELIMFDLPSMREAFRVDSDVEDIDWHPDGNRILGARNSGFSIMDARDGRDLMRVNVKDGTFQPPGFFSADGSSAFFQGGPFKMYRIIADDWRSAAPAEPARAFEYDSYRADNLQP